jgi:hypothetical protein
MREPSEDDGIGVDVLGSGFARFLSLLAAPDSTIVAGVVGGVMV